MMWRVLPVASDGAGKGPIEDDDLVEKCPGNKTRAAEVLGIDPSTLHRRSRPRK